MTNPDKSWNSILRHVGFTTVPPDADREYVNNINKSFGEPPKVVPIKPEDVFSPNACSDDIQRLNYNIDSLKGQRRSVIEDAEKRVVELDQQITSLETERLELANKWVRHTSRIRVLDVVNHTLEIEASPPELPKGEVE